MSDADPKQVVRRLIAEVMNQRDLTVLDELYSPRLAPAARRWIESFLESFSDTQMRIVELVAEGETVAALLACSATQPALARLPAHRPTLHPLAKVYFFRVGEGRMGLLRWPIVAYAKRASRPTPQSNCRC